MKFTDSEVPVESFAKFGLTVEKLKENGDYERLLNGGRTSLLSTNSVDGNIIRFEQGKFSLKKQEDKIILMYDGVKAKSIIPNEYKGHTFTAEEKEDINKLKHLGKTVQLINAKGETKPYFVSIDKETNTMLRWDASKFKAPDALLGVNISKDQQALLKEGKPIFIAGMKDAAGQEFSAYVVADAVNKKMAFISKDNMLDKFVAPEHKAQVNKNNKGLTDEKSKNIQGAAKTKQTGEKETHLKQKQKSIKH